MDNVNPSNTSSSTGITIENTPVIYVYFPQNINLPDIIPNLVPALMNIQVRLIILSVKQEKLFQEMLFSQETELRLPSLKLRLHLEQIGDIGIFQLIILLTPLIQQILLVLLLIKLLIHTTLL